jgi:hypothetical protein
MREEKKLDVCNGKQKVFLCRLYISPKTEKVGRLPFGNGSFNARLEQTMSSAHIFSKAKVWMGKYLKKGPKYISSFSKNNKWQYGLAKVE